MEVSAAPTSSFGNFGLNDITQGLHSVGGLMPTIPEDFNPLESFMRPMQQAAQMLPQSIQANNTCPMCGNVSGGGTSSMAVGPTAAPAELGSSLLGTLGEIVSTLFL